MRSYPPRWNGTWIGRTEDGPAPHGLQGALISCDNPFGFILALSATRSACYR